jgi:hypothetical protein
MTRVGGYFLGVLFGSLGRADAKSISVERQVSSSATQNITKKNALLQFPIS